jgi:hypothetical protein
MKIAVAVDPQAEQVSGHAGKARHWLLFDCLPGAALPAPEHIVLTPQQLPHEFQDDGPHPLHGVQLLIAGSAGDGFIRHMATWGAHVLLTGERDPRQALAAVLGGQALPDQRFDVTTVLCKVRDLFSRH